MAVCCHVLSPQRDVNKIEKKYIYTRTHTHVCTRLAEGCKLESSREFPTTGILLYSTCAVFVSADPSAL